MSDYSELKAAIEYILNQGAIAREFIEDADALDAAWVVYEALGPSDILALIAENDELKAVFEQPASLNAEPADEYEVLKRQFFALRNYALCKDKLSGYYSRELEKLRCVDRSLSAGEIDAERDINEQLTNDLLAVETERDQLRAENAGLRTGYEAYERVNAELRGEGEALRNEREGKLLVPVEPSPGLLMSMAMRNDHALGCPGYYDQKILGRGFHDVGHARMVECALTEMRKLHEEVVGAGFYSPEKEAGYVAMSKEAGNG